MIVAFPFAYDGEPPAKDRAYAERFLSLNKGHDLVQMTDMQTPQLDGVDCVRQKRVSFGEWYFDSMILFPADQFLRVDYDVLIMGDVSDVFSNPFDIAIAKENKGMMNNGVVFVKNQDFFKEALKNYQSRTNQDNWNAIQVATQMTIDDGAFRVRKLSPQIYNHIPSNPQDLGRAKLVHFTDGKKGWM